MQNLPQASTAHILSDVQAQLENAQREIIRLRGVVEDPEVVRMGKIYMAETLKLSTESPAAFKTLMVMLSKMTTSNSLLISNATLGKVTDQSQSTIKRAIKILRDEGWIDVLRTGASNIYRVNSSMFWHETPHGEMAEVSATVILDRAEQDEITRARVPGEFTRHIPLAAPNDYANYQRTPAAPQQELDLRNA